MVAASLADYDGSAGTLVDSDVWIDCIDDASPWHEWAIEQLQRHSERSPLHVNLIIYTELLVPGPNVDSLDALLDVYGTLRSPLPWVFLLAILPRTRATSHVSSWLRHELRTSSAHSAHELHTSIVGRLLDAGVLGHRLRNPKFGLRTSRFREF